MKKLLYLILCAFAAAQVSETQAPQAEQYKAPGRTVLNELVHGTFKKFSKVWKDLEESNNINDNAIPQRDLIQYFIDLDHNISIVENTISNQDFFLLSPMWVYAQIDSHVMSLNSYYDALKRLLDEVINGKTHSQLAWTDLAETYLQDNQYGVVRIIDTLHHHVVDSDGSNLFERSLQELHSKTCNVKESPYQLLYNLYNTVALADYKGYIMLQFSYMILKFYDKGNLVAEANRETTKFESRVEEKRNAIRNALANADRSFYNCDPKQYVEGVNYVKLTKLLQGYIENEVNLNPYGTCRENCAYYLYTEYHGCYKEQFCSQQERCRGKVVECKYVDSDMNICKSSDPERRYDWIEYENGRVLGNKGKCLSRNFFKVDSWWRYLFWHCSYCLCLCDGNHSSDRYFNLRPVTSDIEQNKVITGVKITKHNRIIHLQIQQGVLGPRGVVEKSTVSWKPIDNYTLTDKNVQNGIDYHTMNWMDRILDMDEISAPPEHVLTGIRLRKLGHHLNIEVRSTPINFTSGKVFSEVHSTWLGNDNTEVSLIKPRKELLLTNPDIPIRYENHVVDSEHDEFIKFQASSFDADAAQNTVPYFDAQPLRTNGFPVSGFGLIHRGKTGSGGFITPKFVTYDFRLHI